MRNERQPQGIERSRPSPARRRTAALAAAVTSIVLAKAFVAASPAPPAAPPAAPGPSATSSTPAAPPAEARPPEPLEDLGRADKVHLAYFVPTDRTPTRAWREKITVLATFVADLYRRDLARHGCATRGLDFAFDADGRPAVRLVRGKHAAAHYNGDPDFTFMQQWRTVLPEVEAVLGRASERLLVVFAETYDDGPTRFEWRGGVALGCRFSAAGGAGLFSAWILRDAFCAATVADQMRLLADAAPIAGRVALGCGRPNSPRFEFIEDGFGAVAHELGHAFGLPHDRRKERRYIMGNGFRHLRRNFLDPDAADPVGFSPDNARLLAHSRFLAESADRDDTAPPTVALEASEATGAPGATGAMGVRLRGRATDDRGLAAVLYVDPQADTVVGWADLAGTEADLDVRLPVRLPKEGPCRVRVLVIDRGGNLASATATYEIER